jgi:membrane fusion protein, multidrug efflux system
MSALSDVTEIYLRKAAFARPGRRSSAQAWRCWCRSVIAAAADFGYGYLTTGRYLEATDDAHVKADSTIVSPKVSGYIADVLVGDNQPAKAGQLLARIDDRDFRTALDQAQADVAASEAEIHNLDAQIALSSPSSNRKPPTSPPPKPT